VADPCPFGRRVPRSLAEAHVRSTRDNVSEDGVVKIQNGLKKPGNKGFTLIEVLIVIIIIGVLAGLAVSVYQRSVERSRRAEALGVLSAMRHSELRYFTQKGTYTTDVAKLDYNPTTPDTSGQMLHFIYNISTGTASSLVVNATRNTLENGDGSSMVTIDQTGKVDGTGIFK